MRMMICWSTAIRVVLAVERGAAALKWRGCQAGFSSLEMIVQLNCFIVNSGVAGSAMSSRLLAMFVIVHVTIRGDRAGRAASPKRISV
jgi:hypothetical protein